MWRYRLIVASVCLAPIAVAVGEAADQTSNQKQVRYNRMEYRAPQGFGGYAWNTPLGKVARLAPDPVYVRVAYTNGKVTYFDYRCWQQVAGGNGETTGGTDNVMAMLTCRESEGDGFHALAEYYVDSQGFRVAGNGGKAVLFPVTYQFCDHWSGFSNDFKGDPKEQLKLCGVRLHFRSETDAQAQAITDHEYRTAYERILDWLIDEHGVPEDYEMNGVVYIPDLQTEPRQEIVPKKPHRNWYWCRPQFEALVPKCEASIVLAFDAETGRGQVIFLTAPVWVYAYARQFGSAEGDPLYRVLHGSFGVPTVERQCMDSFLCRPPPREAMPEKLLARFRLSNNSTDVKH